MKLTGRFMGALSYAAQKHSAQRRKGTKIPYVAHVLGVAAIALEYGANEDEAIAALLHDTVEDQGGAKAAREIETLFGARVREIVEACSDTLEDPKPPWRLRKERYLENLKIARRAVALVSAADKLHNARSILRDYQSVGEELWSRFTASREETLWYYESLAEIYSQSDLPRGLAEEIQTVVGEIRRRAESKPPAPPPAT